MTRNQATFALRDRYRDSEPLLLDLREVAILAQDYDFADFLKSVAKRFKYQASKVDAALPPSSSVGHTEEWVQNMKVHPFHKPINQKKPLPPSRPSAPDSESQPES